MPKKPPVTKADVKLGKTRLIDAATRSLVAHGVSQTSLAKIAEETGVTRAALYYYVTDRADLVFQVYRRSCELLARGLEEAVQSHPRTMDRITGFVSNVLGPEAPDIASITEIGILNPSDKETVQGLHEGVIARLSAILKQGTECGELRPMDHEVVARTVISLIGWVPYTCFWTERMVQSPIDRQVVVRLLNDLLAEGWAKDRAASVSVQPLNLQDLVTQITPFDRDSLAKAKRERILATAIRLFNWKGIDTTSLDEIAAELKVTKRTLYQRVGDKEALIQACYDHSDWIWRHIYNPTDQLTADQRHGLTGLLRNFALAQQHPDLQPLRAMRSLEAYAPNNQSYLRKRVGGLTRALYRLFEQAKDVGDMRNVDHGLLRVIILGASAWLTGRPQNVDESVKLQTSIEVSDVLRLGLTAI
jgi:AcrR family transcriptional regulator